MKTTLTKAAAAGLTALVIGNAAAQESVSKPVGYETLTVRTGFNYLGLRLHEAPLASGKAADVVGNVVTLPDGLGSSLVPGAVHIFEVTSGDDEGAVSVFTPADDSDVITLNDDLSDNFFGGDEFTIRPQASLASVFGADNSAGLDAGFAGTGGADQVWVPLADGSFAKYYFDNFVAATGSAGWADAVSLSPVVPSDVGLFYADGVIIIGDGEENKFVVSGSVKTTPTSYALIRGFNYLSSVAPAGGSLATLFGETNSAGLAKGFAGTGGADQVWVPTLNSFDKYYYDDFVAETASEGWANVDTLAAVDPTTVSLDGASGIIVINDGDQKGLGGGVPSFYSSL